MKERVIIVKVLAIVILAMARTLTKAESYNSGNAIFPNVTGPSDGTGRHYTEGAIPWQRNPKKAVEGRPQYDAVLLFSEHDYDLAYSIQCKINTFVLSKGTKACVLLYTDEVFGGSKVNRPQIMLSKCKYVFVVLTENTHNDYYVVDLKNETVACTRFGDEANDERRYCVLPIHTRPKEQRSYKVPCGLRHTVGIEWYKSSEKMNPLRQLLENKKCFHRKTSSWAPDPQIDRSAVGLNEVPPEVQRIAYGSKVPRTRQSEDVVYETTAAVMGNVKEQSLRSHKTSKMLKGYQYKLKLKLPRRYIKPKIKTYLLEFSMSCKHYATNIEAQKYGIHKEQIEWFKTHDKNAFVVLVMCLLRNEKMSVKSFDPCIETNPPSGTNESIMAGCGLPNTTPKGVVEAAAANMLCKMGYLIYNGVYGYVSFAHQSIYKAIEVAFGKKYINKILEFCHLDFLLNNTVLSVKDITAKENIITVSKVDYENLIFRIIKDEKRGQWKIFKHNGFANDVFVKTIFSSKLFTNSLKKALCSASFIKQRHSSRILCFLASSTSCRAFRSNVIAFLKPLKGHMTQNLLCQILEGACISVNLKIPSKKIKVKYTLDECFLKASAFPEDNSKIISFTDKNVRIPLDHACCNISKLCEFLIQKGIDQTILDTLRSSNFDLKQKQKRKILESLFDLKRTRTTWLRAAARNRIVAGLVKPIVRENKSRIALHHPKEAIAQTSEYDDVLIFAEDDSDLALSIQCECNKRVLSNGQKACVRLYTDEVFGGSNINKPEIMSKKCNRLSFLLTENTLKDAYFVYLIEETVSDSDVNLSERNQTTTTYSLSYQKSNGHIQFLMA